MASPSSDEQSLGYVKLYRHDAELVRSGLTLEEFGLLNYLSIQVNPRMGYWHGNFSILANEVGAEEERIRYICKKLFRLKKIYFKIRQGQRRMARFYVMGLELTNHRFMTKNWAERNEIPYEVVKEIPKSATNKSNPAFKTIPSLDSEVSYKENYKDNENQNDKDKQNEPEKENDGEKDKGKSEGGKELRPLNLVGKKTLDELRSSMGDEKLRNYLIAKNYDPNDIEEYFKQ